MPDDRYERFLKNKGLQFPSKRDEQRAYDGALEDLLVPEDALSFGVDADTNERVYLMPEDLATHLHVIGASNSGKTNFLKNLCAQLLIRRDATGEGLGVIDPHGDLSEHLLSHCAARGESFADNVVYFTLKEGDFVPVFNPLRKEHGIPFVAKSFVEAVTKVYGSQNTTETPLIAEVIEKTARVLLYNGLSLAEASFFTTAGDQENAVRRYLVQDVPEPELKSFWQDIGKLPRRDRRMEIGPAGRRFDHLLDFPAVKRILGHELPGIDLREIMDRGQIAIFNLGLDGTNVSSEAQQLVGALLLQEFRAVTLRRPIDNPRPFTLIVDEFGNFVSHDVMRVFDEARKFGLRVVLAHQGLEQLLLKDQDPRLHGAVLRIRQKMIFGGGLVEDQLTLARQAYARWVDLNKRKLEIRTKSFRPKLTKKSVESWTDNWGQANRAGRTTAEGSGVVHGDGGEPDRVSENTSLADSIDETNSKGGAHSLGEVYVTEHEEFEQLSSVQFESPDEQIFRQMQELIGQPTGRAVLVTGKREPQKCEVPLAEVPRVSATERERFLHRVYQKACYLPTSEAVGRIEERRQKLLRAAPITPEIVPAHEDEPGARPRTKVLRKKPGADTT